MMNVARFTENVGKDVDLTHPWAAEGRIPIVRDISISWPFEVALVVPSENSLMSLCGWEVLTPTAEEAGLVADLINYRRSYYSHMWKQSMLERPLDVDDSTNSLILVKMPHSWVYARASWRTGAPFLPLMNSTEVFPDLADLIDSIYTYGDEQVIGSFAAWKQSRTIPVLPEFDA